MQIEKIYFHHDSKRISVKFCLLFTLSMCIVLLIAGCNNSTTERDADQSGAKIACDADNGGITLPEGFCATVVTDSLGPIRHIAVAPNGDIYVKTRSSEGEIIALRDTTGDFHADIIRHFGDTAVSAGFPWETGVAVHNGYIWASNTVAVYRWPLPKDGSLVPEGKPDTVVSGFPVQFTHASKTFSFDNRGNIYVAVGAPSNACQVEEREKGSPGIDPCPILERHGGIWRFKANELGQTQMGGTRYATGLRNVVGLDWNSSTNALYVMQHGRDQLQQLWPDFYTLEESAELPAESMYKVDEGDRFSWPYGYFDQNKKKLMLSPEYGGNGKIPISDSKFAGEFEDPVFAFPGHWAPNDLLFYTGTQFPEQYRGGAFVAFHGSWNRAPLPQGGYKVCFVPFKNGVPTGDYETFADDFAGMDTIPNREAAKYRPVGLSIGPDGALYISDSQRGRIWRVVYTGEKNTVANKTETIPAAEAVNAPIENTPDSAMLTGATLFQKAGCNTCHTTNPNVPASTGPVLYKLYGSKVILQDGSTLTVDRAYIRESILNANKKIVAGYMPVMPSYNGQLTEEETKHLVSYIASL